MTEEAIQTLSRQLCLGMEGMIQRQERAHFAAAALRGLLTGLDPVHLGRGEGPEAICRSAWMWADTMLRAVPVPKKGEAP